MDLEYKIEESALVKSFKEFEKSNLVKSFVKTDEDVRKNPDLETDKLPNFIQDNSHGLVGDDVYKFLKIAINNINLLCTELELANLTISDEELKLWNSLDITDKDLKLWDSNDDVIRNIIEKYKIITKKIHPDQFNANITLQKKLANKLNKNIEEIKQAYTNYANKALETKNILDLINNNKKTFKNLKDFSPYNEQDCRDNLNKINTNHPRTKVLLDHLEASIIMRSKKTERLKTFYTILAFIPFLGPILTWIFFKNTITKIYNLFKLKDYIGNRFTLNEAYKAILKNHELDKSISEMSLSESKKAVNLILDYINKNKNNEKENPDKQYLLLYKIANTNIATESLKIFITNLVILIILGGLISLPALSLTGFLSMLANIACISGCLITFLAIIKYGDIIEKRAELAGLYLSCLKSKEIIHNLANKISKQDSDINYKTLNKCIEDFTTHEIKTKDIFGRIIQKNQQKITIKPEPKDYPKGTNMPREWVVKAIMKKSQKNLVQAL